MYKVFSDEPGLPELPPPPPPEEEEVFPKTGAQENGQHLEHDEHIQKQADIILQGTKVIIDAAPQVIIDDTGQLKEYKNAFDSINDDQNKIQLRERLEHEVREELERKITFKNIPHDPPPSDHGMAAVLAYYGSAYAEQYLREELQQLRDIENQYKTGKFSQRQPHGRQQMPALASEALKLEVLASFEQKIKQTGFLTCEALQGELDRLRYKYNKQWPGLILREPQVGGLLKGLMRVAFVVDTTLQIAFSAVPLLTLADLKTALLKNKDIGTEEALAALGQLDKHPLVRRNFQLNALNRCGNQNLNGNNPDQKTGCLSKLSSEELLRELFDTIPDEWENKRWRPNPELVALSAQRADIGNQSKIPKASQNSGNQSIALPAGATVLGDLAGVYANLTVGEVYNTDPEFFDAAKNWTVAYGLQTVATNRGLDHFLDLGMIMWLSLVFYIVDVAGCGLFSQLGAVCWCPSINQYITSI